MVTLDVLEPSNVDEARALVDHWGYDPDAFAHLLGFSEGCSTVAYAGDEAVGMTLGFPWGEVGWVGSVLTLEDHRGKGIGQATVEESMQRLREAGCETIKLYATPKAIPLYERIGFTGEAEYVIANGSRRAGRDPDVVDLEGRADEVVAIDAEVFPGRRRAFLEDLIDRNPGTSIGVEEDGELVGFAMARAGPSVTEIGPVVAAQGDANVAQALVDGLLVRVPDQPVELIHPKDGWAASTAWSCRGFVGIDTPLEMRHGPPVEERRDAIVACAGQEVG